MFENLSWRPEEGETPSGRQDEDAVAQVEREDRMGYHHDDSPTNGERAELRHYFDVQAGSRPDVGSSSRSRGGAVKGSVAMDTRLRCPPTAGSRCGSSSDP